MTYEEFNYAIRLLGGPKVVTVALRGWRTLRGEWRVHNKTLLQIEVGTAAPVPHVVLLSEVVAVRL